MTLQILVHDASGKVLQWQDTSKFDFASPQSGCSVQPVTQAQWDSNAGGDWWYSGGALTQTNPHAVADAAAQQIGALQEAFAAAATAPVTDSNGIEWNGGEHSASSIDGAVRLAQNTSASTVDLWDYANTKHSLSISAGQAVVDAVAGAYQAAFQKYQGLRSQVVAIQQMAARANSTDYASGDERTDGNGNIWKCTTAGTSGSKTPTWPTSPTASSTVTDGGVTWTFSQTQEAAIKAVSW